MTARGRSYWERHAARYDRVTRFLARPVPRMLELAAEALRGRGRVLEVAAGTGLVTAAIAPVVGELVATDYAEAMVRQLEARVRGVGLPNVRCEQADPVTEGGPSGKVQAGCSRGGPDLLCTGCRGLRGASTPGLRVPSEPRGDLRTA
jgi:protein-L-isoaspartate O-methyltransferase